MPINYDVTFLVQHTNSHTYMILMLYNNKCILSSAMPCHLIVLIRDINLVWKSQKWCGS